EGRKLFSTTEDVVTGPAHNDPYIPGYTYYNYDQYAIVTRNTAYLGVTARVEKRLIWGLTPYMKAGPGAYRFKFGGNFGDSTRWSPGLTGEAGITLGWPRGFTLSAGYSLLGFDYSAPHFDLGNYRSEPGLSGAGTITQDHGWRWMGGPSL